MGLRGVALSVVGLSCASAALVTTGTVSLERFKPVETTATIEQVAPGAEPEPVSQPKPAATAVPEFQVLRVTPDGDMLVAGTAAPRTTVSVMANGEAVGTVEVGDTGDFVYTTDQPLRPGRYEVRLAPETDDPASFVTASVQTGIVGVPQAGDEPAIALLARPNEPSEATLTPSRPSETIAAAIRPTDVRIEAVEVEGDRIYIAGGAKRSTTVRLYVDETFVGEAASTPQKRFLVEAEAPLEPGEYTVRADVVRDGQVIARARVPLVHRPEADAPKPEPEALRTGSSVIIRRGDSLWRISRRTYGRGVRYSTIYEANRDQIVDPDRIYPGQVFSLPGVAVAPG